MKKKNIKTKEKGIVVTSKPSVQVHHNNKFK